MYWPWRWLRSALRRPLAWYCARLEREHARLQAENRRMYQELRDKYGGGPIPFTRAEIERLREAQKHIPPERRKEIGCLDLDKDVIEVDEVPRDS